jgi:hypothetical protein
VGDVSGSPTGYGINFINNLIVSPKTYGIDFNSTASVGSILENNVILNPGSGYISTATGNTTQRNNYENASIATAMFADTLARLQSSSPLIDAGYSVPFITTDYFGNSRVAGSSIDIGPVEYQTTVPQATPVRTLRIQNATTAFGVNIPVGTIVVNLATNTQFQANAGVISTATLTTASSSFTSLGGTTSTATNLARGTEGSIPYQSAAGTTAMLANGTANKALISTGGTSAPQWGSPWTTSNTSGSSGSCTGNAATVTTNANMTGDVTSSGSNATTIASGAVSLAKMANLAANSIIGNNTGSAAAPAALSVANVQSMIHSNRQVDNFQNAADSLSGRCAVVLTYAPIAGSITVMVNRIPLPSSQFGIDQTTHCVVLFSCYKYDNINVSYNY